MNARSSSCVVKNSAGTSRVVGGIVTTTPGLARVWGYTPAAWAPPGPASCGLTEWRAQHGLGEQDKLWLLHLLVFLSLLLRPREHLLLWISNQLGQPWAQSLLYGLQHCQLTGVPCSAALCVAAVHLAHLQCIVRFVGPQL